VTLVTDFDVPNAAGGNVPLSPHAGRALLIVNIALKCPFSPQLAELESLRRDYGAAGFEVLGFPCSEFTDSELADMDDFGARCAGQWGTTFPIFGRTVTNGANAAPLFTHLKRAARGLVFNKDVKWNFTKFLIDRHGQVADRQCPTIAPPRLIPSIEAMLADRDAVTEREEASPATAHRQPLLHKAGGC
jgi:glutathione peroxidase